MSIVEDKHRRGGKVLYRVVAQGGRLCVRAGGWLASVGAFIVWGVSTGLYMPIKVTWALLFLTGRIVWGEVRFAGLLLRALFREIQRGARKRTFEMSIGFIQWVTARDGAAFFCALCATLIVAGLWVIQPPLQPDRTETPFRVGGHDAADPLLARVNKTAIRLSDVEAYARQAGKLDKGRGLTPPLAWRRGLVEEAVEHFLLASAAQKSLLDDSPDIKARIKAARYRILVAAFLDSQIDGTVTPKAVWDVYEAQLTALAKNDEYRLSVIEMNSQETALAVKKAIDLGVSFEEMAKKYSVDVVSSPVGGDLGYVRLYGFPERVVETILVLSQGEVSRLLGVGKKWYLYKLTGRKSTAPPSYSQVKENIRSYLEEEVIVNILEELNATADIKLYKEGYDSRNSNLPVN